MYAHRHIRCVVYIFFTFSKHKNLQLYNDDDDDDERLEGPPYTTYGYPVGLVCVYSVQRARVCVCVQYRAGRGDAQLYNIISVNARRVIDTKPTAPAAHGPCQIRTKGTLTPSFISVYVIIIHSCTFRLY